MFTLLIAHIFTTPMLACPSLPAPRIPPFTLLIFNHFLHNVKIQMGLQSQLSDASSESFLVLTAVLLGKTASYLHSQFLTILRLFSPPSDDLNFDAGLGSALVVLCDQLSINRQRSYTNRVPDNTMECVVCLNRLAQGDHVRRLSCRHVFHKDCFDGWLHHLNFNCPLCRTSTIHI